MPLISKPQYLSNCNTSMDLTLKAWVSLLQLNCSVWSSLTSPHTCMNHKSQISVTEIDSTS